jgi:ribose transport system substrate-binding protein
LSLQQIAEKEGVKLRLRRKSSVLVASGVALMLALSACSSGTSDSGSTDSSSGDSAAASGETLQIAMVSKGFQHQFWQAVGLGAQNAADEFGVEITFEGPESESQVDKQLEQLQAAIDRGVDAIGYASLDPEAPVPLLEKARELGIPVYMFDAAAGDEATFGEGALSLGIARTDGEAAAALAADEMAKLIGSSGKVGVIVHSQTNATGVQRRDGFVNQVEANYPDIEIVSIQYGDGDHQKSADIAKAILAANPDLKGFYATNEGSAIGVVNALKELAKQPGDLAVIGFDSGAAQVDAVKTGLMSGAITQNPIGIGYQTVKALVEYVRNGTVPSNFIDTGFYYYTAENYEDPEIAAVLYE